MSITCTVSAGTYIVVWNPDKMRDELIPVNPHVSSPVYIPCPYADWSLHCPQAYSDECKKCPIYKASSKKTDAARIDDYKLDFTVNFSEIH